MLGCKLRIIRNWAECVIQSDRKSNREKSLWNVSVFPPAQELAQSEDYCERLQRKHATVNSQLARVYRVFKSSDISRLRIIGFSFGLSD